MKTLIRCRLLVQYCNKDINHWITMQQGKSLLNAHIQETWHIQVVWTWQKKGTLQLTRKIFPYITFPSIVFFLCMLILTTLEIFDKYSKHYMVLSSHGIVIINLHI